MDKGHLTLVPEGGLANRMKAVASAYSLCQATGCELQVVWFRDWALNARFCDIFIPVEALNIREAGTIDHLLNDRPRRHNLWLPLLPQRLYYDGRIRSEDVMALKQNNFDFANWLNGRRCWLSCYLDFGTFSPTLYRKLFRPCKDVLDRVEERTKHFSAYTIGMHIRRTDNVVSIKKSPTNLFIEAGQKELEAHSDLKIFLATDSDDVKQEMRSVFGDRLITTADTASRNSTDGIIGGLVDMYTLSRVVRIYGSVGSTFSKMAADIGDCPLVYMEKKDE